MQKMCCDIDQCEVTEISCLFENLSKFQCECKYYSKNCSKFMNDTVTYNGNEFNQWYDINEKVSKKVEGGKGEPSSLKNIILNCNDPIKNLTICIKSNTPIKPDDLWCFCTDNTKEPKSPFHTFNFEDVFTNRELNLTRNIVHVPPPH